MVRVGVSVVLAFFIFNARPAMLGQLYGDVFWALSFGFFLFTLFSYRYIKIAGAPVIVICSYFLFIVYLLFQGLFLKLDNTIDVFKSLFLTSVGIYSVLFLDREKIRSVVRITSLVYVGFSISYIVTFLLTLVGVSYVLFDIVLPMSDNFTYTYPVLFPFSPIYSGQVRIFSEYFPRAVANFREPGLLQMVVIVLYWLNYLLKVKNYFPINFFLLVLLVTTFSSAGFISFIVTVALYFLLKGGFKFRHYLFFLSFIALSVFLLFFSDTQFSMLDKFENQSGIVRLRAAEVSLELLRDNVLMGIGFQNDYQGLEIGVNFLGTLAQIGLVGGALVLFPIGFAWVYVWKKNVLYLTVLAPVILTLLFSQPLYDKAFVVFILIITVYLANEKKYPENFNSNSLI